MIIREIQPIDIDLEKYKKRTALEDDVDETITEDTIITTNGIPVILYCKMKENLDALRWAVQTIKYETGPRTLGLISQSRIFGYRPRITVRHDYCNPTSMATEFPKQHFVITDFASQLTNYYQNNFPEVFQKHEEIVNEKILPEWKIENSIFTSGIVNKDNALKYHFDSGNFKGVLSNMVAFKKNVVGGRLVIPSYNIKLEISDSSLCIFDGQSILHGVSPFYSSKPEQDHYRYTIVYYSLEQMWKCEPFGSEIKRIRKRKKDQEHKRIDPDHLEYLTKQADKRTQENQKEIQTVLSKNKVKLNKNHRDYKQFISDDKQQENN
jgi:hypothetical protein